jgi:hypothetical protein
MEILILTVPTSFSFCFKSYFAILIFLVVMTEICFLKTI